VVSNVSTSPPAVIETETKDAIEEEIFSLKITFVHPTCVCSYVYVTDEVFHKIVKAHHIALARSLAFYVVFCRPLFFFVFFPFFFGHCIVCRFTASDYYCPVS
jgi:hypothetical protein